MIKITAKANSAAAVRDLSALAKAFTPDQLDPVVGRVAAETLRSVVEHSPKRWFGDLRRQWQMRREAPARWTVENRSRVAVFLEYGTANAGTGRIYPVRAKALFIPLTRRAALGYRPGLVYGKDYILRTSVKGITPRWIARDERVRAEARLYTAAFAFVSNAIKS